MKALIAILAALALTGCASNPYADYRAIHEANAKAQEAKYRAFAEISASGGDAVKVGAMFALMGSGNQGQTHIAAPKSLSDNLREWAGILVPSLVQGYGMYSNTRLGMAQSDNATALGISTNETFLGMTGYVQAPAPNLSIGGSGVIGAGSYSTDTHAISNSYNPVDNSNQGNPVDNADNSVVYPTAP